MTIRVGLVGYGYAGKTFHAPLIGATDGLVLVAVASSDARRVRADLPGMVVHATPEALIAASDIDAVVIATPNDSHAPLAMAALAAGRHVVVEKPFALSLDEAHRVADAAAARALTLAVFHNRRWDADFLGIKAAIGTRAPGGQLGRVSHFESHFDRFRPAVRNRWREAAGPGGGVWSDLGPHLIDQALCLFGLPTRVVASVAVQREGAQTDDWAHVVLEYPATRVVLHCGMLVAGGSPRFVVHGSKGSLVCHTSDVQEAQLQEGMAPGAPGWGVCGAAMTHYDGAGNKAALPMPPGDQRGFYARFAAALHGRGANPVPPAQTLAVMAVLEAAREAATSGQAHDFAWTADDHAAWA